MDTILGGLAFFALIAAQLFAVVAVHDARWESRSREHEDLGVQDLSADARVQYLLNFGS